MNGYQFIFSTMHTAISNFPNYLQRNQYPTHTPQLIKQITQTHTLKKSTRGNTPFRTNFKKRFGEWQRFTTPRERVSLMPSQRAQNSKPWCNTSKPKRWGVIYELMSKIKTKSVSVGFIFVVWWLLTHFTRICMGIWGSSIMRSLRWITL